MPAHGSKSVFKLGTSAAPTAVGNMSQYGNSVGLTLNRDTAEVTTFAKGSKQYIPGLKDATVPFEGPYEAAADQIMWDLYNNGTIVTFEYYPAGEGTGLFKYVGQCFVTSYELSSDVSDASASSGEFQVTGDVARVAA